ncbi:ABC transporter ATP-binding protein [Pseudomonas sp. IT-P291]
MSAADAQSGQPLLAVATDQFVYQRHQNPCPRRADRMAKGDCAAVDVDLAGVPTQLFTNRQRLGGEGFIGFNQVQVLDTPAGLLQSQPCSRDWADAHDRRVYAGAGIGFDSCQYRKAQRLCFSGAGQQQHGGTIVEGRSIAGGHAAVFLECRFEFRQRLRGAVDTRLFVGVEDQRFALALRNQDRGDFALEAPALNGCCGFLLRGGSEGILCFTRDLVLLRQILGGDTHVVVVEGVPQAILDHAVLQLRMAHTQAGACLGQNIGGQTHVFLTASDDQFCVAAADCLDGKMDRLETGAADLVQSQGGCGVWQASLDRGLACRVLPGAGSENLAEYHFINLSGIDTRLLQQAANHCGTQFGCGNCRQSTLEAANGGTSSGNDYDFVHA